MAESNRRGEDAADEHVDGVFDDAVDDDAQDDESGVSGGGTATKSRKLTDGKGSVKSTEKAEKVGFFGRIGRFVREIVAELRKVIWPTRNELLTYTAVVLVFLTVMMTVVTLLDLAYARGVLFVFGDAK
ncbi:preprotein translocase subunit SecE [Catellatospora sichuanensis]|uniref:preprotein translocase subunit SecE n=1 Tax=Catellatospora sichuanensis TaxID=1969805 RepID=UPI001183B8DF|nr:preprotein translocase subunit SecE [Catellatospora sichuanensis]